LPYGIATNCYHFKKINKLKNPHFEGGRIFYPAKVYGGCGMPGSKGEALKETLKRGVKKRLAVYRKKIKNQLLPLIFSLLRFIKVLQK